MAARDDDQRTVIVECQLFLSHDRLTAKQAGVIEDALRQACEEFFPEAAVRGLWVHEGV